MGAIIRFSYINLSGESENILTDIEENLILYRIKKHDTEAFRFLYEYYFTKIVLFAESYLYDEEEARDLVQDLFFHLWDHSEALHVTTSIKSYLFTSVRNRCLNILRDRKIRDEHNNKLFEAQLFSGTEDVVIDEEIQQRLQEALDSLPDKCREIILLKVVEGKKNKEIANQLNIAETTVKTQVQRAYRMLREKLIPILLLIEYLQEGI